MTSPHEARLRNQGPMRSKGLEPCQGVVSKQEPPPPLHAIPKEKENLKPTARRQAVPYPGPLQHRMHQRFEGLIRLAGIPAALTLRPWGAAGNSAQMRMGCFILEET